MTRDRDVGFRDHESPQRRVTRNGTGTDGVDATLLVLDVLKPDEDRRLGSVWRLAETAIRWAPGALIPGGTREPRRLPERPNSPAEPVLKLAAT